MHLDSVCLPPEQLVRRGFALAAGGAVAGACLTAIGVGAMLPLVATGGLAALGSAAAIGLFSVIGWTMLACRK